MTDQESPKLSAYDEFLRWKNSNQGKNIIDQANTTIIKSDVIDFSCRADTARGMSRGKDFEKPSKSAAAKNGYNKFNNIGTHLENARNNEATAEEEEPEEDVRVGMGRGG